jgi:hypothetical protein
LKRATLIYDLRGEAMAAEYAVDREQPNLYLSDEVGVEIKVSMPRVSHE